VRILAIDTSLAAGSVAAADDAGGCCLDLGPGGSRGRNLLPRLAEAAETRGWRLREAQVVAVVRGPGSFTGLRIGVSTAKAIAWAGGARLVPVSGFELVARRITAWSGKVEPLAIAFEAGRGEVYGARVAPRDSAGDRWAIEPPAIASLAAWLADQPPGGMVAGPALASVPPPLHPALVVPPAEAWTTTAFDAAGLARLCAAAEAVDPSGLVPEYLRPSYAEDRTGHGG